MKVSFAIGLAGLLMLQSGCAGNAPTLDSGRDGGAFRRANGEHNGAPDLSSNDYKLGSGDRIRVLVLVSNLSGEFEVGAAGTIDMPLIGSVPAMGVTVGQFQNDVTTRLRNGYLNDPKVSVQVLNYRPYFITGEVQKTGEFPYKAGLTVQDAIGVAGATPIGPIRARLYPEGRCCSGSVGRSDPAGESQSGRQHPGARTVLLNPFTQN